MVSLPPASMALFVIWSTISLLWADNATMASYVSFIESQISFFVKVFEFFNYEHYEYALADNHARRILVCKSRVKCKAKFGKESHCPAETLDGKIHKNFRRRLCYYFHAKKANDLKCFRLTVYFYLFPQMTFRQKIDLRLILRMIGHAQGCRALHCIGVNRNFLQIMHINATNHCC